MKRKTTRLAMIGPRKGQIFIFDRPQTTVAFAKRCLRAGQQLVLCTLSYDEPTAKGKGASGG